MSQMLFDQKNGPSGNAISIDNIKNIGYLNTIQTITTGVGGGVNIDLSKGGIVQITITANVAVTLNTPINMPVPFGPGTNSAGYEWTLFIQNSSGGALTTGPAITGGAKYRVGTITNPPSTTAVVANLLFDGTNHVLVGQWTASSGV